MYWGEGGQCKQLEYKVMVVTGAQLVKVDESKAMAVHAKDDVRA